MTERIIEVGKYYGIKMNLEKTKVTTNSRPPT
jgi:hypothetical protein